ncbi:S1-C subfamily serine protease [Deinococcus metalli]|uniref:Serine protease n=1 Tax=Deinococcus metalli TaxID=1141878 RepID=A0A7W8NPX5_9DEIO|nr:trypsin-like peptidase domain-containing protein [Deinococcus metalli]MBB5376235.1 S1-C subfamily serine protease [Deinococcus metalli]GHF39788.1 serine protease [Deinococcus metalli]
MTPESARPGRVAPSTIATALLGAALLAGAAHAATTAVVQATSPTAPRARTAAPVTAAETKALAALFTKVRPATLRIEQCPPTNCASPDGVGSAVLISADGLALTAYHVVAKARALSAQTVDKKRYALQVLGFDEQNDIALLRVNVPANTPYLKLAAKLPTVGDLELAVGNGNGAFLTAKNGRLIALNADAGRADFPPGTLELDAPLIPGDSGGPIVNVRGELTGIVSYIRLTPGSNFDPANPATAVFRSYAVPVTATDALLAELKTGVKRDAPQIGVGLAPQFNPAFMLDEEGFKLLSDALKLGPTAGAFFTSVSAGSPAALAGLKPLRLNTDQERESGDIVTEVNGKRVLNFSQFQYAVRSYKVGDTVTLTVLRDGKTLKIPLTLTGSTKINN